MGNHNKESDVSLIKKQLTDFYPKVKSIPAWIRKYKLYSDNNKINKKMLKSREENLTI